MTTPQPAASTWVDPADPLVMSYVLAGKADPDYVEPNMYDEDPSYFRALEVASEILTNYSGRGIHPAGEASEIFYTVPQAHRLTVKYRPLRDILEVRRVALDGTITPLSSDQYRRQGSSVFLIGGEAYGGRFPTFCNPATGEWLEVDYSYASTVTRAAEMAMLYLARQLWLSVNPNEGGCELPSRVTSLQREGVSMTILSPQDYLEKGRTGLPRVDLWLVGANPAKSNRPPAVYTPDSPPGIQLSRRSIR